MSVESLQLPDIFNDHEAAREAAEVAGAQLDIDTESLALLRFRHRRSWVYANNEGENPDVVIKVEPDAEDSLLPERERSVGFIQELQAAGVPVENHLMKPMRIAVGRAIGEAAVFVATASEYLPGAYEQQADDYRTYGEALARLHVVGSRFVGRVPGFDPLRVTRETHRQLVELQENDALPQVGLVRLDEWLVARLGALIAAGETSVAELVESSEANGCPPALLQSDVTPFNARKDAEGRGVFFDFSHCITGPWAYDFGRPLEWYRFGRSPKNVETLLEGYAAHVPWNVDAHMLALGVQIAHVRYAASPLRRVADMAPVSYTHLTLPTILRV